MAAIATRRERVILELEDKFTRGIAQAAVGTKAFERTLRDLDGTSTRSRTSLGNLDGPIRDVDRSSRNADRSINQLTGRLSLLRDVAITLGPALVPIGAAGIPVVAGLAAQMGILTGAVGVSVAAFVGLGDGLKALNEYQAAPTAENLAKMRVELEKLGPSGAAFVQYLDSIAPQLKAIQNTARAGLFPGLEDGIDSLLDLGPQVNGIVAELSMAMGDLARQAGEGLSGEKFTAFFDYIQRTAGPMLMDFGQTIGNVFEGLANLMVGFEPLSTSFSNGLLGMTRSFAEWSRGLDSNQSFQSFLGYLQETGPQVLSLLGELVNAFSGIVQAAAPLGQALLPVLTQIAAAFADIASSPIGPPLITAAAGMVAFNRAAGLTAASLGKIKGLGGVEGALGTKAGMGAQLAAMAVGINLIDAGVEKLADKRLDESDLAKLGEGQYVDHLGQVGDHLDLIGSKFAQMTQFEWLPGQQPIEEARSELAKMDEELAGLVETGRSAEAADLFDSAVRSAQEAGHSIEDVRAHFTRYTEAVNQAEGQPNMFAPLADSALEAAGALQAETRAMYASIEAMRAKREAALGAFDAETQWRQALNDATDAQKRNNAGIRGSSEAALDNRNRLSALAAAWNNQSDAVRSNEARQRAARRAFIAAAEGMGVSSARARELTGKILDIPTKREIKIRENTQAVKAAVQGVIDTLNFLDGKTANTYVTTTYTTIRRTFAETIPTGFGPQPAGRSADGGTVPKTGLAYADRHPYLLADGEEVISNRYGQADRHRDLLKAINANRLADGGTVGRLADGGTARSRGRGGGGPRDLDNESRQASRALRGLRRELGRSRNALQREREQRKKLVEARNQYRSEVAGTFRNEIFGNGLEGLRVQLEADRNDANAMRGSLRQARNRGLNGGLFRDLAASGDLTTAQQLARLNRGQIAQYERLYAQRMQSTNALGGFAAGSIYNAGIARENRQIRQLERAINRLERRLPKSVEKGARDGTRKGNTDKSRRTAQRVRTGGRK